MVLNRWVLTPSEGSNDLYTGVEHLISCNNNEPPDELKGRSGSKRPFCVAPFTARTVVINQGMMNSKPSMGKGDPEHSTVPVGTVFQAGIET